MRRLAVVLGTSLAMVGVSAPAYAYAHDRVTNPYLHTLLDVLTLAVATSPLWTAYLWGARRRGLLLALVAVVQVPAAVVGLLPITNTVLHLASFLVAMALTGISLWYVHRAPPRPQAVPIRIT